MEAVFLKILNMSITAGWIVLAVVLLRLLLRKAPKWISCLLWVLVGLRLVLPFSFESKVSVVPNTETVSPEIVYSQTPTIDTGVPIVDSTVNPVISESLTPDPRASVNPIQIVIFIATIVWCIGIAGMLIYSLISYLRVRYKVRASINVRENIYICDDINTPFILGLIKPRIYLPSALGEKETEYVIAHERSHLKRRDHLWKPLGFALLTVYWFNPLLWLSYILLCRDIELACDERVIKDMDTEEKKAYSNALLDCSIPRRMISACPLAFGEVGVKNRIKNVLNYKKPAFWIIVVAVIACIVAAVCLLTDPVTEEENEASRVSASDIADMNIGAEMPHIEYADDQRFILSGAFGVLVYNHKQCVVEKRIPYEILNERGIETLNAAVSSNGKTIYFADFDQEFSCKYDMETGELTQFDGDISGVKFFVTEQATDEQRALYNPFYLNSDDVYNTDRGFYYLRADTDWSMKSLQLAVHYYELGHDAYWYIFPELQIESEIKATFYYRDSVDFTEPQLTLTPEDGRFEFVYSGLSSYIGWGRYSLTEDTLTLKTDDGLYTYVFDVADNGFRFDTERSSEIPKYRYHPDEEAQCPVPDGAVFEGDVPKAEYISTQSVTPAKIPNTSDWKTAGLESAGLGDAEISEPYESSFGNLYVLTRSILISRVYKEIFFALETDDEILLAKVGDAVCIEDVYCCDVDGEKGDEIVFMINDGGNGGAGSHTSYVYKVTDGGFKMLFNVNTYVTPFNTGFEYELQAPFKMLVKNTITGYSTVIDYSDNKGYIGGVYDEEGNPLGEWTPSRDCFYKFVPSDVNNDGVNEVICTSYTHLYGHADGIGDSECTLKYNKASGEFEVIDARFIKYSDREVIASGDYYTVTDMGNFTYDYDITNRSGTTLLSDYGLTKEPKIKMVGDSVVRRDISGGTGMHCLNTVYCDVNTDKVSENFTGVWGEYGNKVLYVTWDEDGHSIVVQDMFDKSAYCKKIPLTKEYIATEVVTDVYISEDGIATILYFKDTDYNQAVIRIDLTTAENDLTYSVVPIEFDKEGQVFIWYAGKYYTSLYSRSSGYDYIIQDINGNVLLEDHNMVRWPNFHMVSDSVLCMYIQYGTGLLTRETVYVNVKTGEISPTYNAAYGEYGNNVLYLTHENGYHAMVVCDFFDKEKFYKEVFLTDDKNIHFENIVDWEISPDGIATVTFVADSDYTEKTIEIDMTKE